MGAAPGWRGRARTGALGWLGSRSLREYALGVSLVVLLVSGAFGGLGDSRDDPPATAAAGTTVDIAPYEVTVERVRVGRDLGVDSVTVPKDGRFLLVSAKVTVRDEASAPFDTLQQLVRLEGAEGVATTSAPAYILSTDDAQPLSTPAPDLTYPAAFLFEQPMSAAVPTEVTVVLQAHAWRKSEIEERMGWFDPAPAVRVTVPVTPFAPAPEPGASPAASPSPGASG